jgi:hypothetical protein
LCAAAELDSCSGSERAPATLSACAGAGIAQLNPMPNVLLARSPQTLALRLAPEIQETFSSAVDSAGLTGTLQSLDVSQWRETLTNGFHNGIDGYYARVVNAADLTLIVKTALPALVRVPGQAFNAQVRFQAELVDANQRIVKTWADTATSRTTGGQYNADTLVKSAVEAMYEEIANGLPMQQAAASSPATTTN